MQQLPAPLPSQGSSEQQRHSGSPSRTTSSSRKQPESNHFLQQEAAQAQAMTRKMKLNRLMAEIASVQGRIMAAHSNPAGTEELASLVMQESALKQRMYEESLYM